jgi:hypothetical protein
MSIALVEIRDIRLMASKRATVVTQGGGIYRQDSKRRLRAPPAGKAKQTSIVSPLLRPTFLNRVTDTSPVTNFQPKTNSMESALSAKTKVSLMCSQRHLLKTLAHRAVQLRFIPLKTKRRPLYLKTQSVPRCKHFSSRL